MSTSESESLTRFDELKPGDRIEVEQTVTVGVKRWPARIAGTVVRTEHRRLVLRSRRNTEDKLFSDVILIELPDGELTTVTMDEFTVLRRA